MLTIQFHNVQPPVCIFWMLHRSPSTKSPDPKKMNSFKTEIWWPPPTPETSHPYPHGFLRFTVRRFRVMPASCKNSAKNWPPWHRIWRPNMGPGVRTETQTRWGPRSLLFSWMYPYSYIHLQPWFFIGLNLGLFHYLVTRGAPSWRIHRIGIFTHMNGWFFIGKYTGPMDSPGNQGSLNYAFFWEDQLVQMYGIFEGFFLWWCIVWVRNITWKQGRIFQMTKRWHCNEE